MNLRKIPYPKGYKSLRLFVTYIREFQLKRYKLLNEIKSHPINIGCGNCTGCYRGRGHTMSVLESVYLDLLLSIRDHKFTAIKGKLCKK